MCAYPHICTHTRTHPTPLPWLLSPSKGTGAMMGDWLTLSQSLYDHRLRLSLLYI